MGGPRFRILGGPGGPKSQQAHDVVTTSMRRNDVALTSFRRRVPTRFLINQCQMITFLIFKYDIIENSRIELRGIVVPLQVGGLLGGPKGMLAPPLKLLGGPGPPSSYAYVHPTSSRREMCTSSEGKVIYHKFSHGAAFYTFNGKNVNVMLECHVDVQLLSGSGQECQSSVHGRC